MEENQIITQDENELSKFLNQPQKVVISSIIDLAAGTIATDKGALVGKVSRFAKAVLNGQGVKQFAEEISTLQKEGKVKAEDFEKKNVPESLIDVLDMIENESLDQDKLRAIKAMFYATLSEDDKESVRNYQLLKIITKLNSSQILIIKAAYKIYKNDEIEDKLTTTRPVHWANIISKEIGHNLPSLISKEEEHLVAQRLLTPLVQGANITKTNARLTDLGIAICEKLEKYDFDNLKK